MVTPQNLLHGCVLSTLLHSLSEQTKLAHCGERCEDGVYLSCRDTLTGKHPVQLSEWWADFDERVMRPVFNKPDAMGEWTPRAEGVSLP